jgi:hypothetical protein
LELAAANLQKGSARNGWEDRRTLIPSPPNFVHVSIILKSLLRILLVPF